MSRALGRALFAIVVAIAVGRPSVARAISATTDEPPRVVAWAVTADDQALIDRVRGQLSDLDVALDVVHATIPVDASDGARFEKFDPAVVLVVVWFTRPAPGEDRIEVHVLELASRRKSVRMIGDGAPVPDALSSATLEAAALVVREAVRAVAEREIAPAPLPATSEPPQEPPPRPAAARVSFRADLAWSAVFDGTDGVRHGPGVGLAAHYGGFEPGLLAGTTLPTEDRDAYGVIRLRRHVFGARTDYEWRTPGGLALALGIRAGLALYARSTENPKPEVTPSSGSVNPSLLVGPELRLGWAPASGPFELTLVAGLDVVPNAPEIGYDVNGRFVPTLTIERVQPVVGLGVAFLSGESP